jgi:FKBP-type peptidyl-prolyl cis-trans isomerase FkpA
MVRKLLIFLFFALSLFACSKSAVTTNSYGAQAAADDKIIQNYIAANGLSGVAKKIDTSGVYYIVLAPGSGTAVFNNSTQVTVGDTGRILATGTVFTETNDFHPSFVLGQVILGWRLGIPQIKPGGTVRLLMPSRYAYGPSPQPDIGLPANAVLDFDITLYGITN